MATEIVCVAKYFITKRFPCERHSIAALNPSALIRVKLPADDY